MNKSYLMVSALSLLAIFSYSFSIPAEDQALLAQIKRAFNDALLSYQYVFNAGKYKVARNNPELAKQLGRATGFDGADIYSDAYTVFCVDYDGTKPVKCFQQVNGSWDIVQDAEATIKSLRDPFL